MSSPTGPGSADERKKPRRNLSDNNGPSSATSLRRDSRSQSVALGQGGAPGLVFDEVSSSDEDSRSNTSTRDHPQSARETDSNLISAFEWLQRAALNDQITNQSKFAETEDIELDLSISDLSGEESDEQLNENESNQSSTSHTPESSSSSNPLSNSQTAADNKTPKTTKSTSTPLGSLPRLGGVSSAQAVGGKGTTQKSPRESKDVLSAPNSARGKKSPRNSAKPSKPKASTKLKVKIPKAGKEDGAKQEAENEAKAIVMDGLKFVPNEQDLEKRLILGGSFEALVKALTSPTHQKDNSFAKEFLLTLPYFSTPLALMNMLVDRFEQKAPEGESDRKEFDQKKSFIQLRVIEVFQQWIETNFNDFREGNNELVEKVVKFCDTELKGSIHDKRFGFRDLMKRLIRYKMAGINKDCLDEVVVNMKHPDTGIKSTSKSKDTFAGTDMMKWFKKQLNLDEDDATEVCNQLLMEGLINPAKESKSIGEPFKKSKKYSSNLTKEQEQLVVLRNLMPHNSDKPSSRGAKDFDALNFAKQLTYFEFNLFKKISFREVNCWILGKKEQRETEAPNLDTVVTFVNKVSSWVATEVISAQTVKARQTLIKRFILIAQYCLKHKNYNGLLEIVGGLNNPSVKRLNQTWKTMNKKYTDILGKLSMIVSPEQNWKNYRPLMQNEAPPLVPYIGLFLADLTFINDGNPTKLEGIINWKKMKKLSAILLQIQRAQQSQYSNIQPDPDAQAFLRQELFILDDKELFKRSRVLEPPEVAQNKK